MTTSLFSPQDLRLFAKVLERACLDVDAFDEDSRSAVATRIMHLARRGERDFEVLRAYATATITKAPCQAAAA